MGTITDHQRKQAMELQFHSMMNMDPSDRAVMLGQMMQQFSYTAQMMQNMPADQQKQFMAEVMQMANQSGLIPRDGGSGTPPAKQP